MKREIAAVVWACLAILGGVRSQLEDDNDFCICVDVSKCRNGFIDASAHDGEGLLDKRIQTCEGIQICCPVESINSTQLPPATDVPVLPTLASLQGCGVRRISGNQNSFRISGGKGVTEETFYGEAPWMARILVGGNFSCGGSLINRQAVLTGAHCVDGKRASEITVEVGEWDTKSDREPLAPQKQSASKVVLHPEFNKNNLQHDLAIIFLPQPFTISEVVDTICTPDKLEDVDGTECITVGWGQEDIGLKFPLRPILRKVQMPLMDRDKCVNQLRSTRLGKWFNLLPGFLCAGGGLGDTCKGDGGGPLYCPMKNGPNRFAVVGITAWGIECGKGNPSVFASVPHYINWISKQLNADH